MKEFEVTLTAVSRKTFKLRADSQEDAFLLAEAILENTGLLDFSGEDVDSISAFAGHDLRGTVRRRLRSLQPCL